MNYQLALSLGVLVPLISFAILVFLGPKLGKPRASYVALAAIGISCLLSTYVLIGWNRLDPAAKQQLTDSAYRYDWGRIGEIPITVGVKLDSLTVLMFFMVTFIAFWIHFFSIGYMEGHSDEVDHVSKYHRFFTYLSLFCFSMLGLVVSSSLLFLFMFWELVGLCSYLLIGFYFDKKYASNAAIKAFVTNRVGDFGFILGLALVVMYCKTFDLDAAAASFAEQFHSGSGIFASPIKLFGFSLASLMGIGLFCGAMGKSAQFPLHVWLPDAMAGPTPVSALIHAATMVAAGVYLVARVFRLLTPEAQFFIAVIGCITLTITALIAIVQTDIKKVLAYSTLSQLGYMIFAMGIGAWVAALFHLMTHAFFKAMLFLGSGQVIEGCHHEQDIRKMGGLRKKMPVTCWTFFIGVLAIAGFGIPHTSFGLGGFFSKDEILAVAYERAYNLSVLKGTDAAADDAGEHAETNAGFKSAHPDSQKKSSIVLASDRQPVNARLLAQHEAPENEMHASGHGSHTTGTPEKLAIAQRLHDLPQIMFWIPIIIAYVTPFYMMRVWFLTFCGAPRDHHVYDHAHESKMMFIPLVVLAAGTVFSSYLLFRPMIHEAAKVAADSATTVAVDGQAHSIDDAGGGTMLTLTHQPGRDPHTALIFIVGPSWLIGMGLALVLYRRGLSRADRLRRIFPLNVIHTALENKLYFDHVYDAVLVGGTIVVGQVAYAIDKYIVDGLVNLAAIVTRTLGVFTGRQLDMPVKKNDWGLIDLLANEVSLMMFDIGGAIRRPQSGRIRGYVAIATGCVATALLFVLFFDQVLNGYHWLLRKTLFMAAGE
jgi:proton-translocating NADH-quinone oxidoreductase chain L